MPDMTYRTIAVVLLTHPLQILLMGVVLFHAVREVLIVATRRWHVTGARDVDPYTKRMAA